MFRRITGRTWFSNTRREAATAKSTNIELNTSQQKQNIKEVKQTPTGTATTNKV
jgi:hypothetical protein